MRAACRWILVAATVAIASGAAAIAPPAAAGKLAEPPSQTVDITLAPARGHTLAVRAGGDLQAALDAAAPGSVITLEAGAMFTGPFTLPAKPGAAWVVVQSSAAGLPPPGRRATASHAALMPKLVASDAPVLVTEPGAHHYRFIGIEIHPVDGSVRPVRAARRFAKSLVRTGAPATAFADQTLVLLGDGATSLEQLPHHLIFDRCYLHGDPRGGARRGIALNARHAAVIDSTLADFKAVGVDSQAILGWNGPGPFRIENNYLEGAGENLMFGGGTPSIRDLVPSDIEIRGNHFAKPVAWKADDPAYEGTPWTIKNLLELKNARRVRIEGNRFERSWVQAQTGFAILLTVRTEDDKVPWAVVEDVLFAGNVVRDSASGIYILGTDDGSAKGNGRARRITVRNNLFQAIGAERWGGGGRLFQLQRGAQDVVIQHNTALQSGQIVWAGDGEPHTGFVFADNIAPHNEYGIIGSGAGVGEPSLQRYFPGAVIRGNVIVGGEPRLYPSGNHFPASLADVGFVDQARGDYRLKGSSRYRNAGVDFAALEHAMSPAWIGTQPWILPSRSR